MFESPGNWVEEQEEKIFPVEQEREAEFQQLKAEYVMKKGIVEKIRNSDECVQGGSSFYDISGNLLSVLGSAVRTYEYSHDPKGLENLSQNLSYLNRYMDLIDNNPQVRYAELTKPDGAFPEARQAADRAGADGRTQRPIIFYIDSITPSENEEGKELVVN